MKDEQKERKGPSHINDRKGKSLWQQEKRRRTYICIRTGKKEREWWPYDNGEEYVTKIFRKFSNKEFEVEHEKTTKEYWGNYAPTKKFRLYKIFQATINGKKTRFVHFYRDHYRNE